MSTLHATNHFTDFARNTVHSLTDLSNKSGKAVTTQLHCILEALSRSYAQRQSAQQDAYLAESTSIVDLERRMHDLDRMDAQPRLNMITGMH
ncbi:DUF3563 family protein [Actimicrobium antarcticum]|uniref:DUF3563 domain-containing protein n=1 Tax=Actimicrobium antarcticum TaxID=1051899 RepID=A0ABP7T156_9BURK